MNFNELPNSIYSKFENLIKPIDYSLPELPKIKFTNNINSAMDTLKKNNLISEIDKLKYELEWKKSEIKRLENRLNALEKNNDISESIRTFIFITIISIIIPFIFIVISNVLDNSLSNLFLIIYIVSTFITSMIKLYQYLKKV
ncbi:MAG: hypothetical protein N2749_06640 [Clostridia bacterium]|nr:hypothetical protein [Clostridia bacterium]